MKKKTIYEFNAVHRDIPTAQSCLWDYTIEAGLQRLAEDYGARFKDYAVTISKRDESGNWVVL